MTASPPRTSSEIRESWCRFFEERGHRVVPSASLIPHDPSLLLTSAGMVPFKPYMLGDEVADYKRAASVQKCFRATDIDRIGATARHLTFFEMLGNFSFGDYFKSEAIPWAWELVTELWGHDPEQLWVTVYEDDEEAASIWREATGVIPDRIVARGSEDNFWHMGAAGPCGPCSEIFFDRGAEYGPDGGPAVDEERFVEIWNLVFMQNIRDDDGNVIGDLPTKNIDTGAGLERNAMVLQGVGSVFEIDTMREILAEAESLSGVEYGKDDRRDVSLRVLTDHARSVAFLIGDGVFPSNEARGYVLRRILRRCVRHARLLGIDREIVVPLVERTIDVYSDAYPDLGESRTLVTTITRNEESRFARTLSEGLEMLEKEIAEIGAERILPGSVAFKLHDTYGFPIDLTREVAAEAGIEVDDAGFEREMDQQRRRAHARRGGETADAAPEAYRDILDRFGPTRFIGYTDLSGAGKVLALISHGEMVDEASEGDEVEVVVDSTPFYGEAGGQVGDTGAFTSETGKGEIRDAKHPVPDLISHVVRVGAGRLVAGEPLRLEVDSERRERITKNHTATHVIHWALREVLGDHVKQAGSLVAPDRLRFDFNHFSAPAPEELAAVEELANEKLITNAAVRTYETTKTHAEELGAIAFFGDKYGELVRVVEAGDFSRELCGGTHVSALGEVGPVRVVSEGSIGSNVRRIEALSGVAALRYLAEQEALLRRSAVAAKTKPEELPDRIERLLKQLKEAEGALKKMRADAALRIASELRSDPKVVAEAKGGRLAVAAVASTVEEMRDIAGALRDREGIDIVILGSKRDGKASLVAALSDAAERRGLRAAEFIAEPAKVIGGGGGKGTDMAVAGGPDGSKLGEALERARRLATEALSR